MKTLKRLAGLLNTLEVEVSTLTIQQQKLNYQLHQLENNEPLLYEALQSQADTENMISSVKTLNERANQLIANITLFSYYDPEDRDPEIRAEGRNLKQQSIAVRSQYKLLQLELDHFIQQNPQLQDTLDLKVLEDRVDKFNRSITNNQKILDAPVREEVLQEAGDQLSAKKSELEEKISQVKVSQIQLEELLQTSKREAFDFIINNETLIEDLYNIGGEIQSLISSTSIKLIQHHRKEGIEEYYSIIRILPPSSEELDVVETYHKQLMEDINSGYYGEWFEEGATLSQVLETRKKLQSILEEI